MDEFLELKENVSYGLLAGVYRNGNPLDEKGDATSGVLKVNVSFADYNKIEVKILGMQQANLDTPLLLCAYITEGSEEKKIRYIGASGTSEQATSVSYNEVA